MTKQAVVVRRDLRLRRSEVASYVARASSAFLVENKEDGPDDAQLVVPLSQEEREWLYGDQKTIVLGVQSESTLKSVFDHAEFRGLTVSVMTRPRAEDPKDGSTHELVCVAIGPHDDDAVDEVTGDFKLM